MSQAPQVTISQLQELVEKTVILRGWVVTARSSGSIMFIELRDGTGFIQAVVDKSSVNDQLWQELTKLTIESSVELSGKVTKHPKKNNEFELQVTNGKIIQLAEEYPLGKKEHGPDFLLDNRHLWLRSNRQRAILKIRDQVMWAMQDWLRKNGFVRFDSPILTPNACEGTTTLFEINYFDWAKAYLSQSGQLYLEAAIASLNRAYDFGPVFRAEKSKTRRHLIEFWMMDAEAAFVEHEQNMVLQEQFICYIVEQVLINCQAELLTLERDIKLLQNIKPPFPHLTYHQAIEQLHKLGSDIKIGDDLGADDETILTKQYHQPIFVEKYPAAIKAFYMKRDPSNSSLVLCADLLASEGYGEIIGGSQREDDYQELLKRLQEQKLPVEQFQWYLDLRKFGSVPHSGFGVGLERLIAWICGLDHVRETIPFPRLLNRLNP